MDLSRNGVCIVDICVNDFVRLLVQVDAFLPGTIGLVEKIAPDKALVRMPAANGDTRVYWFRQKYLVKLH